MPAHTPSIQRTGRWQCLAPVLRALATCLLAGSLLACASTAPQSGARVRDLPPLQHGGTSLAVDTVASRTPTPDLLDLDDSMREFVATYAGGNSKRQRLMLLHRAVRGAGTLGIEYDPFAEGTASEVFHGGAANCLSYANMFVALAREAGLDARYQWLEVRPQWTRMGERVAVRLHVNVSVHLPRGERYMVDIDPLPSRDIAGSQELSDSDAQALYHSNIAMEALAQEEVEQAWSHAVRALQLAPEIPHLWVNIGAVYRRAGQHRAAEASYLYALELDPWDRSAMTNLAVLYELEGRAEEWAAWNRKVEAYRDTNPYYHAWLGDMAGEEGQWRQALEHYEEAVSLSPEDSRLLHATALVHYQLDHYKAAARYLREALKYADLRSDITRMELELQEVERAQLVAAP
jgi:Flp pilus assembly protein TadD